jgi:hypothetical protein
MSQENMEVMRRGFEHFGTTGDFLPEILDPEFRMGYVATGLPVDMSFGQVFTLRHGRQVRMEMYASPEEALEAAGLSE